MDKNDERKFLHDLANPLSTALFLVEIVLESFQSHPDLNQDELNHVREIFQSLDQVKNLIQDRKKFLTAKDTSNA